MTASLSAKQWVVLLLVNIIVSALTAFFVFRALVSQANSALPPVAQGTAVAPALAREAPAPAEASVNAAAGVTPTSALTSPAALAPAQGAVTPTLAAGQAPSATLRATRPPAAAPTAAVPKLKISTVLFPGQLAREVIVIVNMGDRVDLKGWRLSATSGISYTFPNVSLFKEDFINLHTAAGADNPTDLFWNRTEPAWKIGDAITLYQGDKALAEYKVK